MSSCCSRFLAEFRLPFFSLQDTNGKTIDLNETFASTSKIVWFTKFLLVVFGISGIAIDISDEGVYKAFWLSKLTHWGELIGTTYLILSFIVSVGWIPVISGENEKEAASVTAWAKILWGLFPAIITMQTIIVLMYWFTVYEGGQVQYDALFGHGLLFLGIAFDGHFLNRTPIRVKQLFFVYFISVPYVIWTLIHGLATDIGNPKSVDTPDGDDDALYSVLNWSERPLPTFIVVVLLHVVAGPLFFAIYWGVSLVIPRRYLSEEVEMTPGADEFNVDV
jgi:hypothetical protein